MKKRDAIDLWEQLKNTCKLLGWGCKLEDDGILLTINGHPNRMYDLSIAYGFTKGYYARVCESENVEPNSKGMT